MSALEGFSPRPILLVTNDLGPRAGGIETFILGLLEQLDGNQIVIYTSSQPGDRAFDAQLLAKFGIIVVRDGAKILLPTPRVNRSVAKVLRKYQSQYVWFGAAAPLAWMAPVLRRAGAKRLVSLSHGHEVWWSTLPPFTWIMRHIGNSLDAIGYLGSFTRNAMSAAVGKHVSLVRIAPGIDLRHFTPGEKDSGLMAKYQLADRKVIISVGRLVHRKGQDKLIEAMPEIVRAVPNALLLLIGQGPYKEHLEKLVEQTQMGAHITFVGRLTYAELPLYIRLGDIFAMPSRSRFFGLEVEGLGIVYLEASACGLPVVAGDSGGAPDAVIEGETGEVVDGTSTSEIAATISTLLLDPSTCKAMGEKGRAWIEAEWDWKMWGAKFSDLLLGK